MSASTRMNTAAPETPSQRYATLLNRLVASRDWARALDTARAWLSEDPQSLQAHLSAGQALVSLERYDQALPHLTRALEGAPNHAFTHRLLSIVSFHQGKFKAADEHIGRAIELQPNDATHWYHLAWMRYKHGALDIAARHANRALELAPHDSHIFNLLALCERGDGKARFAQYQRALELDPENGTVHNNLGIYYLNVGQDYARAEACFRRALQIDPGDETAQRNLFIVLRHRNWLYRALRSPLTMVEKVSWARSGQSTLTRVALVGLWLMAGKILWGIVIFWCALVFPVQKAYEYLTLGDIRAAVGIPGARRGGLLGYRRWPFAVRLGIFVALMALFWAGVYAAVRNAAIPPEKFAILLPLVILPYALFLLGRYFKRWRLRWIAWRGEKRFRRAMQSGR